MSSQADLGWFIGVDIGGTFTDVVLAAESGPVHVQKVSTTVHDPVEGVIDGIGTVLDEAGVRGDQVDRVVHATTLATNLILEQRGARVAFAATRGFGDLIRIPRGSGAAAERAPSLVTYVQPKALVPPWMTVEVPERMSASGEVLVPLDEDAAHRAARRVAALAPEAIAVCFLHSYVDARHERLFAEACRALAPHVPVYLSSEISPAMREYGRAVTTVISGYVGPAMGRYLERLESAVRAVGIGCPIHVMESGGGVMPLERAADRAVHTVESGPAAGVISTRQLAERTDRTDTQDLLSLDMGGTTAKCGVVRSGDALRGYELYVGGRASSAGRHAGGYPIRMPVIDLAEVGAGGGSVAWIDAGGALNVGPESAGADPGPACYGRGGTRPTVTDANLVLGYVNPVTFRGSDPAAAMQLAREAIRLTIAEPLDLTVLEAAAAVYQLVTANMAAAVRMVTIERGLDPRDFVLVSFGGCGPIHAAEIARTFGIARVVVPAHAGVRSAVGLLGTDLTTEQVRSCATPLGDGADLQRIRSAFSDLEDRARRDLGIVSSGDRSRRRSSDRLRWTRLADVRYRGQAHQLVVEVPGGRLGRATLDTIAERFFAKHREAYGVGVPGETEIVNCRVRLEQRVARWTGRVEPIGAGASVGPAADVTAGERDAWFDGVGEAPIPAVDWTELVPGDAVAGPAVVDGTDTTVVVPPAFAAEIDKWGDITLMHQPEGDR